ncbi:MAG: HlyD family type I secretion periplasmic adaptor subunit [Deltaproteobacteria bacterium]|nr:MAG: HlyD family type I secretion periplasmic adaptor subunit [Deltaproteobacteria bacterium]
MEQGKLGSKAKAREAAYKGWLRFFREEEDLFYMSEVDAAIHRRGHEYAYLVTVIIAGLMVIFLIWAALTKLDEVTRGTGQVIPSQRVQVIQNLEGGILQEILVQENQIVEKGDILVRIDNSMAASQFRDVAGKTREHQAAVARLEAEGAGRSFSLPESLRNVDPQVASDQTAIYQARQQQVQSELGVLQSQHQQKQQEIAEMQSRLAQLERNYELARQQRDIAKPLAEQGVYPQVDYLAREREVANLQGDMDALRLAIPRARAAAEEIRRRMSQRQAEYKAQSLDELNRRRVELKSLQEMMSAGADRVTRTDVRSPVRGTVKQLNLTTLGGVVKPGEPIMEIVPLDDTLLVEARIRPADIAFLRPGQKAMIKITAYDFSIFGGLEGVVEAISADTIEDEKGEHFYKVKLRTQTGTLSYRGENLPIIPGMMASVDILTGKKSVLSYLLKPILKIKQNALRER